MQASLKPQRERKASRPPEDTCCLVQIELHGLDRPRRQADAAPIGGQQDLHRHAAADGLRHPGRHLSQQSVGDGRSHGPQHHVRPGSIYRDGVLSRGAVISPGLQHGRRGQGVGAQGPDRQCGVGSLHGLHQSPAHAAALSVHYGHQYLPLSHGHPSCAALSSQHTGVSAPCQGWP